MKSIRVCLVEYADEVGVEGALEKAQAYQLELESLLEIGNEEERAAASFLLVRVNATIKGLLELTLEQALGRL